MNATVKSDQENDGVAGVGWHLAELNVARLLHSLESQESAEFDRALAPINALAESAPGFVWRLIDESGSSSSYVEIPEIDDPNVIVNYSIWTDVDSLVHFVMKSGHVAYFRRRREWFEKNVELSTVCWWIPAGEIPTISEAVQRLDELRANGPSEAGWPMQERRAQPS